MNTEMTSRRRPNSRAKEASSATKEIHSLDPRVNASAIEESHHNYYNIIFKSTIARKIFYLISLLYRTYMPYFDSKTSNIKNNF